jgi:hypothetical protein
MWFGSRILTVDGDDLQFMLMPGDYDCWYQRVSYVAPYGGEIVAMVNQYFNPFKDYEIKLSDLSLSYKKDSGGR